MGRMAARCSSLYHRRYCNFDPQCHRNHMGCFDFWSIRGNRNHPHRAMPCHQENRSLASYRDQCVEHRITWGKQLLHAMFVRTHSAGDRCSACQAGMVGYRHSELSKFIQDREGEDDSLDSACDELSTSSSDVRSNNTKH